MPLIHRVVLTHALVSRGSDGIGIILVGLETTFGSNTRIGLACRGQVNWEQAAGAKFSVTLTSPWNFVKFEGDKGYRLPLGSEPEPIEFMKDCREIIFTPQRLCWANGQGIEIGNYTVGQIITCTDAGWIATLGVVGERLERATLEFQMNEVEMA